MVLFDPAAILAELPPSMRQPEATESLNGGQSLVHVLRLRYHWGAAILKGPLQPREALFYRDVAPRLAAQGIALPEVFALVERADEMWLLREAFHQLLPYKRWFGDAAVLATLRQLHTLPISFTIPQPFIPTWQPLVEPYGDDIPSVIRGNLAELMARHSALFDPICVIAGDPNATNWGVRADGSVVLFDWDRVGYGVPARDIAVVIPQLGWPTLYEQVASAYLAIAVPEHTQDDVQHFAHGMAMAKLQTTIEYINSPEILDDSRQFVLGMLPSWIVMLWQMDAGYHARFG